MPLAICSCGISTQAMIREQAGNHCQNLSFSQVFGHLSFWRSEPGFLGCNPHRDGALKVRHSQLELLFLFVGCKAGFLECNPHRDGALQVRHSQLELLFSWLGPKPFLECNTHRDGALQVRHSQLKLLFSCLRSKLGLLASSKIQFWLLFTRFSALSCLL